VNSYLRSVKPFCATLDSCSFGLWSALHLENLAAIPLRPPGFRPRSFMNGDEKPSLITGDRLMLECDEPVISARRVNPLSGEVAAIIVAEDGSSQGAGIVHRRKPPMAFPESVRGTGRILILPDDLLAIVDIVGERALRPRHVNRGKATVVL